VAGIEVEMARTVEKDDNAVNRAVLSNGLRVIWENMPSVRSIAVGVWFDVGVVDETPETNGMSHLLEHLVFRGTETRDSVEISRAMDEVGGVLDGFTDHENTMYYVRVLDEHVGLALDLLSDITINARLAPEDVEKEKRVVTEEIRAYEDTPSDRIHDVIGANLFPDSLLGMPVLGSAKTVAGSSRNDINNYRDAGYTAGRAILCAAGNVVCDEFIDLAEKHFGTMKTGGPRGRPELNAKNNVPRAIVKDTEQLHMCIGAQSIPYNHPDRYVAAVLTTALGGNASSRLFEKIRDRYGLAYSVYCYGQGYRDAGAVIIYVGTAPETAVEARDYALAEVEDALKKGLKPDELSRAKECLKGNLMLALEGTAARVSRLAKQELFLGRQISLEETCAGVDAVTLDDVSRLAKSVFGDGVTVAAIGPNAEEICNV
jgi:predicted Zn-dependent peptidase